MTTRRDSGSGSTSIPPVPATTGRSPRQSSSGYYAVASAQQSASPHDYAGVLVVAHLHSLLRSSSMYDANHPQHIQQAKRFVGAVQPAFETLGVRALQFMFVGHHIYLNGRPIRPSERIVEKTTWVLGTMQRVGIAELRIRSDLKEFDVKSVVDALRAAEHADQPLKRDVRAETIMALVARRSPEFDELLAHLAYAARFGLLQFYAEALALVRQWAHDNSASGGGDPVSANRLAARLVDAYASDPSGLLGMVQLKPLAGTLPNRRLDATIVAIAIARELGFDDAQTLELAATSLLRRVPTNWVAWWAREASDPRMAAQEAFRCDKPIETIASFESAAPVGLGITASFYGRSVQPHTVTLLLNVAYGYVDLLQPGPASNPFAPEASLQMLLAQSGSFFEPTIVAALVQALGLWPPGSIVRLNSGDVAVVVHRPRPGADANRPFIRPIEISQQTATYDLSRPELDAYHVLGSAQRGDCSVNPMFVFVQ